MARAEKSFDAVHMMRSIRERLAEETQGMSAEEEMRWLRATKFDDPFLSKLMERPGRRAAWQDGLCERTGRAR